jgi:hypothetical protein
MPEFHLHSMDGPSLWAIERPRCPKCLVRMSLARLSPGHPSHDLRTFECSGCAHIQATLSTDPMKSQKAGWIPGDFKPPD